MQTIIQKDRRQNDFWFMTIYIVKTFQSEHLSKLFTYTTKINSQALFWS